MEKTLVEVVEDILQNSNLGNGGFVVTLDKMRELNLALEHHKMAAANAKVIEDIESKLVASAARLKAAGLE